MLTVIGSGLLLFSACAMLYQADERRGAFDVVRKSFPVRMVLRLGACLLFAATLVLLAGLQGWERGIPVWLGVFSAVFVGGLFLAAQKPGWHGPGGAAALVLGVLFSIAGAAT
ncbi:MAG: hypothetical protein KDA53_04085 [Hyphomonas sp.]|nr:hypothetical protein [Hyphomonas sp.]